MRQRAPYNVARVLGYDLGQHLRTNGRAKTIRPNKQISGARRAIVKERSYVVSSLCVTRDACSKMI